MGSAVGPYSSLDDQILAWIEATKRSDEDTKLEDFQLRTVGSELVLFNLKTGHTHQLYDEDSEPVELQPESRPLAERERAHRSASVAARAESLLLSWFAAHPNTAPSKGR